MELHAKKVGHYSLVTVVITFLLQSCAVYSFSGSHLSPKVKTFSIRDFSVGVAIGGSNLGGAFTDCLSNAILQRTNLTQVNENGHIEFLGHIKEFKYTSIAPRAGSIYQRSVDEASRTQLSITVEVTYRNRYNPGNQFDKKPFSRSDTIAATATIDTKQDELVKRIFDQLVQDILSASLNNW